MASAAQTERFQQSLSQFGDFVLDHDNLDDILTEACRLVAQGLGADLAKVIDIERTSDTGLVRAGIGWRPGVVGKARIKLSEKSSEAFAIAKSEPVMPQDISKEDRFEFPEFLVDHGWSRWSTCRSSRPAACRSGCCRWTPAICAHSASTTSSS